MHLKSTVTNLPLAVKLRVFLLLFSGQVFACWTCSCTECPRATVRASVHQSEERSWGTEGMSVCLSVSICLSVCVFLSVCLSVCLSMYVCMYVCMLWGLVAKWGRSLSSWSMGHEFESHHLQMNIVQSSSPASHHPHQSTQLWMGTWCKLGCKSRLLFTQQQWSRWDFGCPLHLLWEGSWSSCEFLARSPGVCLHRLLVPA